MEMANQTKQKNKQIQGLRTVGLFMILIFHFAYRYFEIFENPRNEFLKSWGAAGCILFFLLSGFFAYHRKKSMNLFSKVTEYLGRIYKLWMPYVAAITIIFAISRIMPLEGRTVDLKEYLCNVLFVNGFVGGNYVDGAHWYLTYLIAFITLTYFLQCIKVNDRVLTYFIWLICNVLSLYFIRTYDNVFGSICAVLRILMGGNYTGAMIAGILIRKIMEERGKKNVKEYMICMICCILFTYYFQSVIIALFMIAAILALIMTNYGKLRFLENKIFVYIGGISYYIYLIHQNIGYTIMKLMKEHMSMGNEVSILCAIAVAFLGGFLLEKKYIWINEIFKMCLKKGDKL